MSNQQLSTEQPQRSSQRILDAIGNTPLVELRNILPRNGARVIAKLESANPTGSMKDRMARALVERAAADGRLQPGGTVVEYTAGTTCLLYTSPSPRDGLLSRMPSSA